MSETPEGDRQARTVSDDDDGKRIDRWLHEQFADLSRSVIQRYIDQGRVTVENVHPRKPSVPVHRGDRVELIIPPPPPEFPLPQDIPLDIVHEDRSMIVIHKPAGLVVHSSPGVVEGGSVVNALLNHTDQLSVEGGAYRPGIVHRLDRETSGLLIIARTDRAHRNIAAQFKERTVRKEYVACVHGIPEPEGVIDQPLGRSTVHRKKMAIRHDSMGKPSITGWKLNEHNERFSWLTLYPKSGRTHQIRVHLRSIGHPIICDFLYGREKKMARSEILGRRPRPKEEPILERHALHAARIAFRHPEDGREVEFETPVPEDMQAVRDALPMV